MYLAGCGLCGGGHSTLFRRVDLFLAITGSVQCRHDCPLNRASKTTKNKKKKKIIIELKYLCDNFTFANIIYKVLS